MPFFVQNEQKALIFFLKSLAHKFESLLANINVLTLDCSETFTVKAQNCFFRARDTLAQKKQKKGCTGKSNGQNSILKKRGL